MRRGFPTKQEAAKKELQYLAFTLGEEDYGVPVGQVIEIVRLQSLIRVPHGREYLLGLLDLRGSVIPVVDLRKKLGLRSELSTGESTRAILVMAGGRRIALAVDRVARVVKFDADSIDPGPPTVRGSSSRHVSGVGKMGDQFIVLLDFDGLFSKDEAASL